MHAALGSNKLMVLDYSPTFTQERRAQGGCLIGLQYTKCPLGKLQLAVAVPLNLQSTESYELFNAATRAFAASACAPCSM